MDSVDQDQQSSVTSRITHDELERDSSDRQDPTIIPRYNHFKMYHEKLKRRSFMGDINTLAEHHQTLVEDVIKDKERIIK